MIVEPKQFDLNTAYPNVLLVGNGILRSLASLNDTKSRSWSESLLNLSTNPLPEIEKEKLHGIPYSVQATVMAPTVDREHNDKYIKEFKTLAITNNKLLADLVSLGFDSILTTNYTYEIEDCFHPQFSKIQRKTGYACQIKRESFTKNTDAKYLLHTFNQFKNSPPIWHIHGEIRRKSSIILTHDEYARLICKLIEENNRNKNKYVAFACEVKYQSWLDYFLMSNLYIVGFGMDFSEFDIWWILNRRMREKAQPGKITYFSLKNVDHAIKCMLESMNVQVITFDEIPEQDYIGLYKQAAEYIKKELKPSKGVL